MKKDLSMFVFFIVLGIAIAFIGYNAYVLLQPPVAPAPVQQLPVLISADCEKCFSLEPLVSRLQGVQRLSLRDAEARGYVQRFSIQRLPALIAWNLPSDLSALFEQRGEAFVLETPSPPFYEVETGQVAGIVKGIALSPASCSVCTPVSGLFSELNASGVFLETEEFIEGSQEADELIERYSIDFLPAFIFADELLEYPQFRDSWSLLGSNEADSFLVMRQPLPPVKNISTGNIEGLVDVVYITDDSCSECYNVSVHRSALLGFNVFIANETRLNLSQAGDFVLRYNVSKVPTVILSPGASVYYPLMQVWQTVGTRENDGFFVYREFNNIPGVSYRDLETGRVVSVERT
ncbi:hypothetical protein HY571_00615 [Candidatus Micrarchaeota archaeon]|nr:hypothetical protein [Candidatus Micrarchaeota archaeon]